MILTCFKCQKEYTHLGQKRRICRDCKREYDREYHRKRSRIQKDQKNQAQKLRVENNRQKLFEYLKSTPCEGCGESDPVVLEFDHIDPHNKKTEVTNLVTSSWNTILEEIKKCRVLCCNCHRRRTAAQLGWYKYIKASDQI